MRARDFIRGGSSWGVRQPESPMARGRSRLVGGHLRLPDVVVRCQVPAARLRTGVKKMQWVADYLDRYTRQGRLHLLVGTAGRTLLQLLCMIAGALMPLLEVVPFSSSISGPRFCRSRLDC
ncbi:exopolysaccharide biosynthesis protein [Chelativorans sp. ZYF759]|uniref:exopolysaccharide biosynthesis protein n=1 Tax=Chelativorans sp. ZYF759 TaxID=2692213 RepID=UPI0034D64B01